MPTSIPGSRLTIFIRENDQFRHRPLASELVHRAHRAGLPGATVLHGVEGYGASQRIHTQRILSLVDDLPCLVILVGSEDALSAFTEENLDLLAGSLVTLDQVRVLHTGRSHR